MLTKRANFIFTIKVVLGVAAALLVLVTWLFHPAMSGEMWEAGRRMVFLLMIGVVVGAFLMLILDGNSE